ncbi:MAG: tyrosine-type recombinase/integrase [Desulfatitalea sp.]|nr:tyrosine-type recombinase/integrase [Desulfatitalea sp.]
MASNISECVRLGVKDIDFGHNQIIVRNGKGQKDRITMLPERYLVQLQEHLARVKLTLRRRPRQGGAWCIYLAGFGPQISKSSFKMDLVFRFPCKEPFG